MGIRFLKNSQKRLPYIVFFSCLFAFLLIVIGVIGIYLNWWELSKSGPIYIDHPIVYITSPTGGDSYAMTSETVHLEGLVWDRKDEISKIVWEKGDQSGEISLKKYWKSGEILLDDGTNTITIKAYNKSKKVGQDSITIIKNKYIDFLNNAVTNPNYVFKNDPPVEITIQSQIKNLSNKKIAKVLLYEVTQDGEVTNEKGRMYDDGNVNFGDDIPDDSVYSFKDEFSSNKREPIFLQVAVKFEDIDAIDKSEIFDVGVVEHVEKLQLGEIFEFNLEVVNLKDKLENQGLSDREISQKIQEYVSKQTGILDSGISEAGLGVWWIFQDGCVGDGIFIGAANTKSERQSVPLLFEKDSEDENPTDNILGASDTSVIGNNRAVYLSPFAEEFGEYDEDYGSLKLLQSKKCSSFDIAKKQNQSVTVEDFKSLSNFSTIIISSHGDAWFGSKKAAKMCSSQFEMPQEVIQTNQKITEENLALYEQDLTGGKLAISAQNNLVILPDFIKSYNKDFSNSIVYVSACRSAYNFSLAEAFLSKNSLAYFGYKDYLKTNAAYHQGEDLFGKLLSKDMESLETDELVALQKGENISLGADFIQNPSFETGNFYSWTASGDVHVVHKLGDLGPQHGAYMALLGTGLGDSTEILSRVSQSFCSVDKADKIVFDYNIISEEPDEFINSSFDDSFKVDITIDGKKTTVLSQTVSQAPWKPFENLNFYGGDDTIFETGWKSFTYDIPKGSKEKMITISFKVEDVGDKSYDTVVLLDDVKVE